MYKSIVIINISRGEWKALPFRRISTNKCGRITEMERSHLANARIITVSDNNYQWILKLMEEYIKAKYENIYIDLKYHMGNHKIIIYYKGKKIVILYRKNMADGTLTK